MGEITTLRLREAVKAKWCPFCEQRNFRTQNAVVMHIAASHPLIKEEVQGPFIVRTAVLAPFGKERTIRTKKSVFYNGEQIDAGWQVDAFVKGAVWVWENLMGERQSAKN